MISCVPYEQNTFTYGPRDYLHQLMSLIGSLRGGQQRYMPLLISKINETMPNAPGYALRSMTGSSKASELYEESQHTQSGPNSSNSTPFGSPPMSAVEQQVTFFGSGGGFPQELAISNSSTPSAYAGVVMTTSMDYGPLGDTAVSASLQLFPDSSIFQGTTGPPKFEPD